ncbi:relaxase/mobilization nuclease domain-containing protein [Spirillospora sp. CA-142024]|uniref:relaxase/mobilization nuclease domain-containing protein n=1 Tax=Spirillospora sp. CA-142024 TaxID=3240036 RepID=UPI003D8AD4E9
MGRGKGTTRLLSYLYGPGRSGEHVNPHLVAGFTDTAFLEPERGPQGRRSVRHLAGVLMAPVHARPGEVPTDPVWHCIARAAPQDPILSDAQWAAIAETIMDRVGLAPAGEADAAVRWVAVRHADDHVHLVATLARQDGGRISLWRSRYRLQAARSDIEHAYGLRIVGPGDRTAALRPTRAEIELARRRGVRVPPRIRLRNTVAAAAAAAEDEAGFFAALAEEGIRVRLRRSERDPGQVTGYAVALSGHRNAAGEPVWFGGGKLASDLSLPKLRCRWQAPTTGPLQPGSVFLGSTRPDTAAARAHRATGHATDHLRQILTDNGTSLNSGDDIAWAAGDLLQIAATIHPNARLRQAADLYDRAARRPYARVPPPSTAGVRLRRAARLLAAAGPQQRDNAAWLRLLGSLMQLADAVARLRHAQHREAQAAAAQAGARHLQRLAAGGQAGPHGCDGQDPGQLRQVLRAEFSGPTPGPRRRPAQPSPWLDRPPRRAGPHRPSAPGR